MLAVISPAKTLDFDTPPGARKTSLPLFQAQTDELVRVMRGKTAKELAGLMRISPKLAELNAARYQRFGAEPRQQKQAALAFRGDVYLGLEAEKYSEADFAFAQKHLRILSGLYGLLRPLDLIEPYRLEMGSRLKTARGASLYDYWGASITEALAKELAGHKSKALVNLASKEYFAAVRPERLPGRLVTPVFKDYQGGAYKVLAFFAKKARGYMATYMVRHRVQQPEELQGFDTDGYRYSKSHSTEDTWVFLRKAS